MNSDTKDIVQFCSEHVTETRSFVVFTRGTCVVINEPCSDPLEEARAKIAKCADTDAPFLPEPTREGDLIITFKEPVFHRFTREQLARIGPWLDQAAGALLSPAETIAAGDSWAPHPHAKVGLLARRRLLEDANHPVPVRIIRAKTRATASLPEAINPLPLASAR